MKLNTYKNNELNETINLTTVTATTSSIKGTSEIVSRILRPDNIHVLHKPISTLRHILTNVKDKEQPHDRQGAVYKINCADCQATYIGETGRKLNMRFTEHKLSTKNGDKTNDIAGHHRQTKHNIDWGSAECLTYSTSYIQRITLESWYTNLQQNPLNRSQQLAAPYKRLIHNFEKANIFF